MRRRPSFILLGLAAPLMLGQLNFTGCLPSDTSGTGGITPLFNLPPTVVMNADVQRGVAPLMVRFNSSGSIDDGVIIQRLWDFDDGQTSLDIAPTHTFQTTGRYTVRLTLTDDQNAQSTQNLIITVTEKPVAVIDVDRTTAESAPAIFSFDGSASFDPDAEEGDELAYRWDFGDGSRVLIPVVTHTFATAGTYRVVLTVTDATGVTGTAQKIIEVGIPRPTITFRAPPTALSNIVCSNDSPLWVHTVFEVEPDVPRMIRAGLDGDNDPCNALTALYDPTTGEELVQLDGHDSPVRAAAFSPGDGLYVLTAGDDATARLYASGTGDFLQEYAAGDNPITAVAFAPDGESFILASSDNSVTLRDTTSTTVLRTYEGHNAPVNAVAISPDGTQLLSGDNEGIAILWSFDPGEGDAEIRRLVHTRAVTSVAFSPTNPERILTGSIDQTARLWNTANGAVALEFGPAFDADGNLVSGHSNSIAAVAFSNDGTFVLTGSDDATAKVWSTATGNEMQTLTGHTDRVTAVAFSPDDTQIITGSTDDTAKIWDVATGEQVRSLKPCRSSITAVAFSPDGETVLVGVAAQNDIQLDTDPAQGDDLNLTLPTALDLSDVPVGTNGREYYLWAELDTDRTSPSRTYSSTRVNVVPAFTTGIDSFTPRIPLRSNEAALLMPATSRRQILDLGTLNVGDRLYLSLLTLPGYGEVYSLEDFSITILDSQQKLYAAYESGHSLFTPDSKMVIGHNSNNYYVICDAFNDALVPSVRVQIERRAEEDSAPREQYIHLNFGPVPNLTAGGSAAFNLRAFDLAGRDNEAIQNFIEDRVEELFDGYDFVISTSAPSLATTPAHTIHFDTTNALITEGQVDTDSDLVFYGVTNYVDPRNETSSGRAVVSVDQVLDAFPGLSDAALGTTLGNIAAHHIGFLSGLRETSGADNDVMAADDSLANVATLTFTTGDLSPSGDLTAIGIQDAPQLLQELFGE